MKILRMNEVANLLGVSRSTVLRLENEDQFPSRINISRNSVGFLENEIIEWIKNKQVKSRGQK